MRATIARALLTLMLITSVGTALSACRHTVAGAKQDIKGDTR
jgi:predicted small secreted protein